MAVRTRNLATAAECEFVITRVVDAPCSQTDVLVAVGGVRETRRPLGDDLLDTELPGGVGRELGVDLGELHARGTGFACRGQRR